MDTSKFDLNEAGKGNSDGSAPAGLTRWTYSLDSGVLDQILYASTTFLRGRTLFRGAVFVFAVGLTGFLALAFAGVVKGMSSVSALIVPIFFFVLPTIFRSAIYSGPEFALKFRTAEAKQKQEEAEEKFQNSQTYTDAFNVDEARLNTYYEINQAQARASFRWAIAMMVLGFSTIISGVWIFYFRQPQADTSLTALSTVAGIVSNLISCFFLALHAKMHERSYLYYTELADIRRIKLAIQLAVSCGEEDSSPAIRQVIGHLLDRKSYERSSKRGKTPGGEFAGGQA